MLVENKSVGWCLELPGVLEACVCGAIDLRAVVQLTVLPRPRRVGNGSFWLLLNLVVVMLSMSCRCRFVCAYRIFFLCLVSPRPLL